MLEVFLYDFFWYLKKSNADNEFCKKQNLIFNFLIIMLKKLFKKNTLKKKGD